MWAQLVTAFLLLLSSQPLEAAGVLQLWIASPARASFCRRLAAIKDPDRMTGGGMAPRAPAASRGSLAALVLFLAHPEVYSSSCRHGHRPELLAHTREAAVGLSRDGLLVVFRGFRSFIVWPTTVHDGHGTP